MSSQTTETHSPIHLSKDEFNKLPELAQKAIISSSIPLTDRGSLGKGRTFSVATGTLDAPPHQTLSENPTTGRYDWGDLKGD